MGTMSVDIGNKGGFRSYNDSWTINLGQAPCKLKITSVSIYVTSGYCYGPSPYIKDVNFGRSVPVKYIYVGNETFLNTNTPDGSYFFWPTSSPESVYYDSSGEWFDDYTTTGHLFNNYDAVCFAMTEGFGSEDAYYVINRIPNHTNLSWYLGDGLSSSTTASLNITVSGTSRGSGSKKVTEKSYAKETKIGNGLSNGSEFYGVIPNYNTSVAAVSIPISNGSIINSGEAITLTVKNSQEDSTLVLRPNTKIIVTYEEIIDTCTITYNTNGGNNITPTTTTIGNTITLPTPIKDTVTSVTRTPIDVFYNVDGNNVSSQSSEYTTTTETIYTCSGWNTEQNGSGTNYAVGSNYTANSNVTLYAQWSSSTTSDTVNKEISLINYVPKKDGYTFEGWSTSEDSDIVSYEPGGTYTFEEDTTLYSVWREHKLTVNYYSNYADTITGRESVFDKKPVKGENVLVKTDDYHYIHSRMDSMRHYYRNASLTLGMTRTGYTGTGFWNTKEDGLGISVSEDTYFATGQELAEAFNLSLVDGDKSINVYAQWQLDFYAYICIEENGKKVWKQAQAFVKTEHDWKTCESYIKSSKIEDWKPTVHKDL